MPLHRIFFVPFSLMACLLPLLLGLTKPVTAQIGPTSSSDESALTIDAVATESVPAIITPTATLTHTAPTVESDRPTYIKGLYMTYHAVGHDELRNHALDLIDQTELNALVLDIKGDLGVITYKSDVITATAIGANEAPMIADWEAFMAEMAERDIYTIARIVVFKDNYLARAHPEWAVKDGAGNLWFDGENLPWLEPFHEEVWDYNIALAVEAARRGFDEVQFDYIRFPTDGYIGNIVYSQPADRPEARTQAITGLLAKADAALAPYPTKLSADVFGYTTWYEGDFQIGQDLTLMAPYLDVISPMLYPSTYGYGLPGLPEYSFAVAHPYQIVYQSMLRGMSRVKATNPDIIVRPWIQDFPDYAFDGRIYSPQEIRAQMFAAYDSGGGGWLLWDPRVRYTREALVTSDTLYPPNEQGDILVLRYGAFAEADAPGVRSLAGLRQDLERLRAAGYYPVNLRDVATGPAHFREDTGQLSQAGWTPLQSEAMMASRLNQVPAGKRPIVLTFDGSHISHYRLLADGQLDPNSALGVLADFHREHPADWPLRATFFVQPQAADPAYRLFGQPEQSAYKLQTLVEWGLEIGLYHAGVANGDLARQVRSEKRALAALVEDVQVDSVALDFGHYTASRPILWSPVDGVLADDYAVITTDWGEPLPSPRQATFASDAVSRIDATARRVTDWLNFYDRHPERYYVAAGHIPAVAPLTITEIENRHR